jgi:hypothetical protein
VFQWVKDVDFKKRERLRKVETNKKQNSLFKVTLLTRRGTIK